MLSDRHVHVAAFVVGEEIARRQRFGHPIPAPLRDLHAALNREVSGGGPETCEAPAAPRGLETAQQQAERLGVSERTIRRRAAKAGTPRTAGRYIFTRQETTT